MTRPLSRFVAHVVCVVSQAWRSRAVAAASLLLVIAMAPLALAQSDTPAPKHKKKHAKPAASASATVDETPPAEASPPPPEATAEPVATASASVAAPAPPPAALPDTPPAPNEDNTNTTEDPNKRYVFVGLRYRGTIVPQFLENIFVGEGATLYSNTIGAEIDIRKGGQSLIPWIQYTDYNTGNILFLQNGQSANDAAFYSVVNSSLKSVYIGIDELWSTPIANHLDFEYGFGVGIGVLFGDLQNNWVYQNANGPLTASNGLHFAECPTQNGQRGCNVADHQNATVAKVGGYVEPNWFNGGAVPVIFPHIAIPQLSLRYKPIKQLETRLSVGFSLTGFWFGLSADYGLEHKDDSAPAPTETTHKSSFGPMMRDTL